jgi:hypothetical protein
VSRRARSRAQGPRPTDAAALAGPADPTRRREDRSGRGLARDLAIAVAAFGIAVGVAELAGAANLGVAFGIGQIAFAIVVVVLLTRG